MNRFRTLPSPNLQAVCLVGVFIFFEATLAGAATFYVNDDAGGANDGSSWENSYLDLQDALAAAGVGDAIWVAAGLYLPGTLVTDTFRLKNGVEIYGGFQGEPGSEGSFRGRDVDLYLTILSGDLAGDDLSDPSGVVPKTDFIVGTNSNHVVTGGGVGSSAVLDGFTINAGHALGTDPMDFTVGAGAGMFNDASGPILSNLTFLANKADGDGGGMFQFNGSFPTLTHVKFSNNTAGLRGGGMANKLCNPTLIDVTFSNNSASNEGGGGIYNEGGGLTLLEATFSGNSGLNGGGIYNDGVASTLINVSFFGNSATSALSNEGGSNPVIQKGFFSENFGGAIYNFGGTSTLTNVLFSNNIAAVGGGIYNDNSSPTLIHVTLSRNSATFGGGLYNEGSSSPIIRNSIFSGNFVLLNGSGPQILNNGGFDIPIIADSLVRGSNGSGGSWNTDLGMDGGGNIADNPKFVDSIGADNIFGTLDDDLRLESDSPAIDAGSNDHLPPDAQDLDDDNDTAENIPFDLDGKPRVFNSTVDMGAYESQPGMFYVDDTATGLANGSDWENAYTDLQSALTQALSGSQIWVAEGVYIPGGSTIDTFQLKSGVEVYGGFEGLRGTEDDFGVRDPEAFLTILSGDRHGDDITNAKAVVTDTANIVGQNSFHVVTGSGTAGTAVLDGFTITAGQADGSGDNDKGGGMFNDNGGPTLTDLTFSGNSSSSVGGGMYNTNSDPTLTNCAFIGNKTGSQGGGMYNRIKSDPTLTSCAFYGNGAGGFGGGMMNDDGCDPMLTNCVFSGNSATSGGGGMRNTSSNPTLTNCSFFGNSTPNDGGGMSNGGVSLSLYVVQNSLFWGNSAGGDGPQIFNQDSGEPFPTITNSLVQGGCPDSETLCTDVIDADPFFADADGMDNIVGTLDDDLRLLIGSPAIDSGSNTADLDGGGLGMTTISDIPTDLDGNPRISNGAVDMGAYEFQQAPPTETPTPTPTFTSTPTETETPTSTATNTPTLANTQPAVATLTPTEAAMETPTDTPTQIPTATGTIQETQTPTTTITATNPPNPTATRDYNAIIDDKIDVLDLIHWFGKINEGKETGNLLFDFSRFWQSDVNTSK